jgi:hypothetical protein
MGAERTAVAAALMAEGDARWGRRQDAGEARAARGRYREALEVEPEDPVLAERFLQATMHLARLAEDEGLDAGDRLDWGEAEAIGWRCLSSTLRAEPRRGSATLVTPENLPLEIERRNTRFPMSSAPCLYQLARVLDASAPMGSARWTRNASLARRLGEKAHALNPRFDAHGPARFLGIHLARLPYFAGRDMDASRTLLDEAVRGSPDFLENPLGLARDWATARPDRGLFVSLLKEVVGAPSGLLPDREYEQERARSEAARLLARVDEVFPARFAPPAPAEP